LLVLAPRTGIAVIVLASLALIGLVLAVGILFLIPLVIAIVSIAIIAALTGNVEITHTQK
jgi:hypothetical protein